VSGPRNISDIGRLATPFLQRLGQYTYYLYDRNDETDLKSRNQPRLWSRRDIANHGQITAARLTGRGIGEPCHCWPLVLGTKDASTRISGPQQGSANALTPHCIGSAIAQIRETHLPDSGVDAVERMRPMTLVTKKLFGGAVLKWRSPGRR
jgi:hypothetical protein